MPEVKNYISAPYYETIRPWLGAQAPLLPWNEMHGVGARIYAGVDVFAYPQWVAGDLEPNATIRSFLDELGSN